MVAHLRLAAEQQLSIEDLNAITVVGESIEVVMKPFNQALAVEKLKAYNIKDLTISSTQLRKTWEK